jgi:hypothetical protein
MIAAVAAPALAQGCNPITSSANLTINELLTGNGCAISSTAATLDSSGNINSAAGFNGTFFNMLAPSYTSTPPNGIGLVTVSLLNSSVAPAPNINELACWDSAGAVTYCNGTYTNVVGVAYKAITVSGGSGGTTTYNYSEVVRMGSVPCYFTGSVMVGHYVISAGSGGACSDGGAPYPTAAQPVGVALATGTGAGYYQIFAMNDLPVPGTAFAGLATPNTFAGAQTFSGAASFSAPMTVPVTSTAPTTDGQITYNAGSERYELGEGALSSQVYPVVLLPTTIVPTSTVLICSLGGGTNCENMGNDTSYVPLLFVAQEYTVPAGYLVLGKTLRLTALLQMNSTGVPLEFYLLLSTSPIYRSGAITPPTISNATFQVTCLVTTSATGSMGSVVASCRPDAPGATFGEIANTETLPYSIDTTANHDIALGVGYGGTATGGNNVQVLSMTIEVLQ